MFEITLHYNESIISSTNSYYSFIIIIITTIIIIIHKSTYIPKKIYDIIQCYSERKQLKYLIQNNNNNITIPTKDNNKNNHDDNNYNNNKIIVSEINIHPIKSLRPISVQSTTFTSLGLEGDRTLMLVRPTYSTLSTSGSVCTHRFLTQRQCPILATINASLPTTIIQSQKNNRTSTVIQLSQHDDSSNTSSSGTTSTKNTVPQKVFIDISPSVLQSNPVRYKAGLWDDTIDVVDVGDKAASFIQQIIQNHQHNNNNGDVDLYDDVRVVSIIPNVTHRKTDERYVPKSAYEHYGMTLPETSLTDGFPILITSEESLHELNKRLEKKGKSLLPMSRFRPNIVVKGLKKPFDEDEWKAIQIGGCNGPIFHIVKGCPRCKQSCTDQMTGKRDVEPLETLRDFRALGKNDEDVYFGQNVVLQPMADLNNFIEVGDEVRILTRGDPVWNSEPAQAE